jgi:predicted nucleic-acid-binding protein
VCKNIESQNDMLINAEIICYIHRKGNLTSCTMTVNGNDNYSVKTFTFDRNAHVQMHLRIYIHRSLLLEFSCAIGANK